MSIEATGPSPQLVRQPDPSVPASPRDTVTRELADGLALSRGTDYFGMRDQLTRSETDLLDRVRASGEADILPLVGDYWERGEFPFELIPTLRDLGIVSDPSNDTVEPLGAVAQGLVCYELGRIDGSVGTFLSVHVGLAMESIRLLGSPEQQRRWLPAMANLERIGAFALTEPDHGSDSVSLETTAAWDGEAWVINGLKRWPGNAVWCDIVVVFARDVADNNVKAFVVERGDPGFSATKIAGKVSLRMVQNADIVLDNVRLGEDRRLVNCTGFADVTSVLTGTRNQVAWASTGHAVAAYEIALTYAQRRTQFGRAIARSQLIQSQLVQMLADVTAMQLYCIRLGRLIEEGQMTDTQAALAKYFCSVKAREVCRTARDILGGNGITLEFHVMRHLCDMESLVTYEGTAEIQRLIVGREVTGLSAFI